MVATNGSHTTRVTEATRSACSAFSVAQAQRARTTVTGQIGTSDAGVDWRFQVLPDLVPPDARGLGTQEGTNAHLLAKRMKHKGMAWRAPSARAMANVRELVTNGALTPWCPLVPSHAGRTCHRPSGAAARRRRLTRSAALAPRPLSRHAQLPL